MSQSPSSPVTDIVSYLRNCAEWCEAEFDVTDGSRMLEAADEIERLRGGHAQRAALDAEIVQTLLGLLNPLHGNLDKQTYDEKVRANFDAPRDAEYDVIVTAQQERDLNQAICILESRLPNV